MNERLWGYQLKETGIFESVYMKIVVLNTKHIKYL